VPQKEEWPDSSLPTLSGNDPQNHFTGAGKMVEIGSQMKREIEDWNLSRFACYLIAQNPEIAEAQKYLAIQTRKHELSDEMTADLERLELRKQASIEQPARRTIPLLQVRVI
jgi:DNA-damage-inducible protein D